MGSLAEHENYCGSRTEKCEQCGEFIMLKNFDIHINSNHGFIKLKDGKIPFLISRLINSHCFRAGSKTLLGDGGGVEEEEQHEVRLHVLPLLNQVAIFSSPNPLDIQWILSL